jgi:hypothetical protein
MCQNVMIFSVFTNQADQVVRQFKTVEISLTRYSSQKLLKEIQ